MTSKEQTPLIVGIDLGTTNSLVAWCDNAGPRILENTDQARSLPSVVRFDAGGKPLAIGREAHDHAVEYPTETIFSIKRLMGRGMADVQSELAYLPYEVVAGEQDTARVKVGDAILSPQQISAILLRELKEHAEQALGQPVEKAVVTVPAYFDDAQRQATRDAGRLAGLEVVRIVNEPTAAALAYDLGRAKAQSDVHLNTKVNPLACTTPPPEVSPGSEETQASLSEAVPPSSIIAVFDLGGGTFDVSILRLQQTEQGAVDQVLATAGDTHLGGDDIDRSIVELIQKEIQEQFGADIAFPPSTRQAFRQLAEAAKKKLSQDTSASIEVDLGEGRLYQRTLRREELESFLEPWIERAMVCCRQVLKQAKIAAKKIDRVILVGGSTRIPAVRQAVEALFGTVPYAALNPDEVVALGAAVQASILAGVNRDRLLLDVIPLSLGIETLGGAVAKLIMANSTIPARATEQFTTHAEGQTNVKIHVLQGERELVKDCRSLGEFDLQGIPPMPGGLPKIEVTFLVDANGVLNVTAIEKRSEKAARVQMIPNHGLTREEVDHMEAQSLQYAIEDMTAHQLIDLRNQARLDIRAIERQLAKVGDQLPPAQRQDIEKKVQQVQTFIAAPKPEANAFHQAMDAMDKATVRLAELAIKQTLTES